MRRTRSSSGYTAIELLIVVGIIGLLSAMATPALLPMLRRGKVSDAANAITMIARQARLLAMERTPDARGWRYGVAVVHDEATRATTVSLILGRPEDARTGDAERIVKDDADQPALQVRLPDAVDVWIGDTPLRDGEKKSVSWFYEWRSGVPLGADQAGRLSANAISVGVPQRKLAAVWGIAGNDIEPVVIAPDVEGTPGFSVRTVDNRIRRAVSVYSSGIVESAEF